jgi:two-component system LytT family sensor kinase
MMRWRFLNELVVVPNGQNNKMRKVFTYFYPAIFGLIIYTSIRLVTDTYSYEQFWDRPWLFNTIEVVSAILTSYLVHSLFYVITARFNRSGPVVSMKNITREFAFIFIMIVAIINPVLFLIHYLNSDPVSISDIIIANIIVALYSLLYYAILRGNQYIRYYIQQQTQMERLKTENLRTELNFLKAQYHPHFIFNALNTIYFQMDESVPEAKRTVEKFSELLRYQLNDQQHLIAVGQELDHLNNFIHLQRQRAAGKLDLQIYYHEEVKNAKIYPLLLLPLVENAFKYVGGNLKIIIEAGMDGNDILFSVQNSLPDRQVPKGNGIGHDHLQKRLNLLYPEKHRFSIEHTKHYYKAELKLSAI